MATAETARRRRSPYVPVFGLQEVADALGVAKQNAQKVPDLPAPKQARPRRVLWRADEILDFAAEYRERTNKPPLTDDEIDDLLGMV